MPPSPSVLDRLLVLAVGAALAGCTAQAHTTAGAPNLPLTSPSAHRPGASGTMELAAAGEVEVEVEVERCAGVGVAGGCWSLAWSAPPPPPPWGSRFMLTDLRCEKSRRDATNTAGRASSAWPVDEGGE